MELQSQNSKFFSYLIILSSLFFVFFVTKGIFETTQQYLDYKTELSLKNITVDLELTKLNELKEQLKNNQSELTKNIARFAADFKSEEVFNYMYSYANGVNSANTGDTIIMRSLSIGEPSLSDLGMNEVSVNLVARFSSQATLLKFLNYLTSSDSSYTFFINTFSYPSFGVDGGFQISIPLKIYYK